MWPGATPRAINEEFTAEQVRSLRAAWPGYLKKIERDGEDGGGEPSDEEFAGMF